jgi:O-antigen ligase
MKFVKNAPMWLDHAVVALITVFVFVIPFHFNTATQEISFYTALGIATGLIAFRKKPFSLKSPLSIPFALFVAWALIGLFFALNRENSIHDLYGHLVKFIILFYLIITFFGTKERFLLLVRAFIISTAIFAAGLMIHFYMIQGNPLSTRLLDVKIPVNILSVVLVFPVTLAANESFRTKRPAVQALLLIAISIIAMAVFLTGSRFSAAVMLLSLIVLVINHRKRATFLILVIAAAVAFFPVKSRLLTGDLAESVKKDPRLFLSKPFVEMIKDHAVTGIGFGMDTYADRRLVKKYNAMLDEQSRLGERWLSSFYYPHNIYIDVAARMGIVGLLIFFYLAFSYFRTGWAIVRRGRDEFLRRWSICLMVAFSALLVIGVFESYLGFTIAVVLYIQCAMMVVLWRLHRQEQAAAPEASAG